MPALHRSPAFFAWAVLVAATLISWALVEETDAAHIAATAAILIGGFKVNMVVSHFMEVRWQPSPYRIVLSCWIAGVMAIILGFYWFTILRA